MREEEERRIRKDFKEEGWELKCGPSDRTTNMPNAGVGIAVNNGITFMRVEMKTNAFIAAYEAGRVDEYLVDLV